MVDQVRILLGCREAALQDKLKTLLQRCGFHPVSALTIRELGEILRTEAVSAILCEPSLADGCLYDVLRIAGGQGANLPVVLISRCGDMDEYLAAMNAGVFDVVAPPFNPAEAERILRVALAQTPSPRSGFPMKEAAQLTDAA